MATVRMKKGDKFADIYDSPETIKQAQFEGYSIVEDSKKKADEVPAESESPAENQTAGNTTKKTKRQ